MIHGPDNTDSIIARMTSRLEFFNSLGYEATFDKASEGVCFRPLS